MAKDKVQKQTPSYQLGLRYGGDYRASGFRKDQNIARIEAWIRVTDGVNEAEFNAGFDAGWDKQAQAKAAA